MTNTRVLVTGASGKIGGAVTSQLLEMGVATRALVHRTDARSDRLRAMGAEVAVADMLDIQQVAAAMDGVNRLFFNPPYHPYGLDSAVAFAVAAHREGVEAVVALLPDTAHIAVDPGFFADNYLQFVPFAVQLGVLPVPTGGRRNAPPSNEDIARVAVGALLDPHRHDGRAYRPTGPKLLSGADMADAVGEALGRRVRHMDSPRGCPCVRYACSPSNSEPTYFTSPVFATSCPRTPWAPGR
jgi:NAD(P)H dehydrogenase (quinone)